MDSFTLRCTTCQRALRVTNAAAIGQILPCPKCGSMVHIVPPLAVESPAVVGDMATATVSDPMPAASSHCAENDIEQFAAEGASILSDDGTAPAVAPPPLPADFSATGVDTAATFGRPGVFIAACAVGAVVCAGAIAWLIGWYLQDDALPVVAASVDERAEIEKSQRPGEPPAPDDSQGDQSPDIPKAKAEPSVAATPQANTESQPPQVELKREARDSDSPPDSLIGSDAARGAQADADAAAAEDRQPQLATPAAPVDSTFTDLQVQPRVSTRKPSIKLEELPESDAANANPAVAQSAGEEAASAANSANAETATGSDPPAAADGPAGVDADDAAAPALHRTAPNKVDLAARLATPVAAIQLRGAPLYKVAATFSDLAGVPVALDLDGLRAVGVRVDRPVTLAATSVTIASALEQTLRPLGLVARGQNGCLQILPVAAGETRKARYAVDDLSRSGDPPIEDLVAMVRAVFTRAAVADANSPAVVAEKGAIHLTAREIQHNQMIELCEKLRVARGRPLRTRYDANRPDARFDPRRFELASRRTKALDLLSKPVTAAVGRAAALADVAEFLAGQAGATILVDHAALAAAGLTAQSEARLVANAEPLEAALGRLLAPLGLTFRVVEKNVLEITTSEAAANRTCLEFYPVRGLALSGALGAGNLEQVREDLLTSAGMVGSKVAIEFDRPSECLIVCASYPEQVRLEQAIRKLGRVGRP